MSFQFEKTTFFSLCLQDMLINFQQIILPDILTSLVKGEPSVQGVVDSFNDDVIRSTDLSKLCSKLETMLRNIIFGTKVCRLSLSLFTMVDVSKCFRK